MMPSQKVMALPVTPNTSSSAVTAIKKGISIQRVEARRLRVVIQAVTPRISRMFRILLPTTLPMAMPGVLSMAAVTLTAASGILVPMATMVRPMTSWGIFRRRASPAAPSTNQSAPLISSANPTSKTSTCNNIKIFLSEYVVAAGIKKETPTAQAVKVSLFPHAPSGLTWPLS